MKFLDWLEDHDEQINKAFDWTLITVVGITVVSWLWKLALT